MCGIICLLQYGGLGVNLENAMKCLKILSNRGPDNLASQVIKINDQVEIFLGFTRLAIMDTSNNGMQPFKDDNGNYVVCNGEIYNYKTLAKEYDIILDSNNDCKVILPFYKIFGFENMISYGLDAEFAMVLLSLENKKLYAARDKFGVRPLYFGYHETNKLLGFASELKALHPLMQHIEQIPPNQIYSLNLEDSSSLVKREYYCYDNMISCLELDNVDYIQQQINNYLTEAVKKRLYSDRPIGFLLSGGLDSSLIVAIATKLLGPDTITCFSIGVESSPDIAASKKVVKFLGIKHHHIIPFEIEKGIAMLRQVIETVETYDVTTIRASTPQFVMAKYIRENTNVRVVLSGEGSDEIHGSYRYFRDAPDVYNFHWESIRLLEELYLFDNKRTDRTMAAHGLEVRVPFLDVEYVEFITRINPNLLRHDRENIEKKILRDSFKEYLPDKVLYRSKEAFSDSVSSDKLNWVKSIHAFSENIYSDSDLENNEFVINKPKTKDALLFRKIFNEIYPGRDNIIPHYWLPKFQKQEIFDPSAKILDCYL